MAAIAKFWQQVKTHSLGRLVLLCVLVGVVAGFGALGFNFILNSANDLFMVRAVGYQMPQPGAEGVTKMPAEPARRWLLFVVPAFGGLLSGLLVFSLAPEAEGHGTDAMIDAFHHKRGVIRKRVPIIKTIASALTIGSGGSAGREGPIAQVGGGFGSALATWLKATDRERRTLLLAGAGAGIGAVFRAPLGGALFAVEVLYRDMEFEAAALVPCFVAAIVSYSIYCGVSGSWGAIFSLPYVTFNHPLELPLYVMLGIVCALMGMLYVKVFYGARDHVFRKLRLPNHVKPALGGLMVGAIGFFLPQVLGMGYGWVQLAMDGYLPLKLIVAIAFVKILATSLTIGSGGSGGVFAPSMVIGGMVGAAVGTVLHGWLPHVVTQPAAFALVGMAGFFAGVAKTPVSSLIMVSEMTTGYGLLAPLMLTTAVGYLLVPRRLSLYENQVESRVDSPAHEGEYVVDLLEGIQVREAMPKIEKLATLQLDAPLPEILDTVADSKQHVFPVLDTKGELHGAILFDDIRLFFTERHLPKQAVVAHDLLAQNLVTVTPDEDLASAMQKLRQSMQVELVVVDHENSRRVVGILGRRDVLSTYHDRVHQRGGSPAG
ncbi:MAG TPA: chloride channel protein [Verrucomicrobiae bacterium]|nr:chloride channel protein [Verrucomicrobiae bacterium]